MPSQALTLSVGEFSHNIREAETLHGVHENYKHVAGCVKSIHNKEYTCQGHQTCALPARTLH